MTTSNIERDILRAFFDTVITMELNDNTVSDAKIVKATQNKLRDALRGSAHRCTCAKVTWGGICEICQGSDDELVNLRNFYIQMRNAKKYNLTVSEIQQITENTRKHRAVQK